MPETEDDVEEFCDKVHRLGVQGHKIVVLFDETSPWMSSHKQPDKLLMLLRGHYHSGTEVFMTTQYLGSDFPPLALNCVQNAYLFRNTSPRALERIQGTFPDVDTDAVRKLKDREFIEVHV
jgi:hypothetical protein